MAKRNYMIRIARHFQLYWTEAKERIGSFRSGKGNPCNKKGTIKVMNEYFVSTCTQRYVTITWSWSGVLGGEDEKPCHAGVATEAVT